MQGEEELMNIPKVIHYCWFGKGKMPNLAEKCIESWKKYCPEYKIVCWNEDNFDVNQNRYAKEAYDAGKWAFVSDYVRLKVLHDEGGIYLDTDVELIKPLDKLIEEIGFMGFDDKGVVSTGVGFACEKGNQLVAALLGETVISVVDEQEKHAVPYDEANIDGLNFLAGVDLNDVNKMAMKGTILAHVDGGAPNIL